jgi:diguanylate cyclase (GGDEF)-like protein
MNREELIIDFLSQTLTARSLQTELPNALTDNDAYCRLHADLLAIRTGLDSIGNGDLDQPIHGKGYVIGTLKGLQASLKHLTWQTQAISSGDYSQRVAFLGDFSHAFNAMTNQLEQTVTRLTEAEQEARQANIELEQANAALQKSKEEYRKLSVTDRLTQLPNRLKLDQVLQQETLRSRRSQDPFAVILLDIDHFKKVNDTHGHQTGDLILQEVAQVLRQTLRETDLAGRWGGEEFLVIATSTDLEGGRALAERLRSALREKPFTDVGQVTCSFGVAAYQDDSTPSLLVSKADEALYQAKDRGRDRVEVFR